MRAKVDRRGFRAQGQSRCGRRRRHRAKRAGGFRPRAGFAERKRFRQQEFDSEQAAKIKSQADLKSAQENVDEENSKVDESEKQLAAAFAEKDMAFSQFNEAQNQRRVGAT